MLTHISLFSGLGADDLAAEWAGFTTILQCEIDKDCLNVLRKYWPNVPKIEDVRNVTKESVITNTEKFYGQRCDTKENYGKLCRCSEPGGCARTFTRGLDLLTAGVPCQPASAAGKRRGQADDRWLWPEAVRVLSELKPTWAVFENPVGISSLVESGEAVSMGCEADQAGDGILSVELSNIIRDIEKKGYEVQPVSISAASVGAPHKRQRIFIIAHSVNSGDRTPQNGNDRNNEKEIRQQQPFNRNSGCSENLATHSADSRQRGRTGEQCGTDRRTLVENQQRGCTVGNKTERCLDTNPDSNGGRCSQLNTQIRESFESDSDGGQLNPDSGKQGLEGRESKQSLRLSGQLGRSGRDQRPDWSENWFEVASRLCSVDARSPTGLSGLSRVSKLKMLGNCNPPKMYYQVYKAIAEVCNGLVIR